MRSATAIDKPVLWGLRSVGVITGGIVALILIFLILESVPALRAIAPIRFFTDAGWHPSAGAAKGAFSITAMMAATVATTAGAILLAGPAGVISAIFCRFYAPPFLTRAYRRIIELMAGIPSVVYGFWGLVTIVPLVRHWQPPGASLLSGILILTLMILPTVALLAEAALRRVPAEYLHASAALSLSRRRTLWSVVLPAARNGLAVAMVLAVARAIGETMAILMVCGNVVRMPTSLFDPVRTLTANIALELGYALELHRSALFVSGLVLMGMVMLLVGANTWFQRETPHE